MPLHHLVQILHARLEHAVGLPRVHLVGADLIGDVVDEVTDVEGIDDPEEEVEVHLEPRLEFRLVEPPLLLEELHAEAVEAGVPQRQPEFRLVHPEAARPARPRGEEDVTVEDLLPGEPLRLETLQVLHEVADGEVGRVALPVVAELLSRLEGRDVGGRDHLDVIAEPLERAVDEILVLPRQPSEEDRRLRPLRLREGTFDGTVEVFDAPLGNPRLRLEPCPLPRHDLLDLRLREGRNRALPLLLPLLPCSFEVAHFP